MSDLIIRKATDKDFDEVWSIFKDVVSTGDTYVYSPDTSRSQCYKILMVHTFPYVALIDEKVVAFYVIRKNKPDLGSHVCNAGYMVNKIFRGKNIGRNIAKHSIEEAKKLGFKAMQFNVVVSTNKVSFKLWKSLGFKLVGTVPEGFNHSVKGLVDIHIMHRFLWVLSYALFCNI